jgi:hypothetical protein
MAKGRTYRVGSFIDHGDGDLQVILEPQEGKHELTIPADWLSREQMHSGALLRTTEEFPGVIRFRLIANDPGETPAETIEVSDNTAAWSNVDEGDQLPPENDITGE